MPKQWIKNILKKKTFLKIKQRYKIKLARNISKQIKQVLNLIPKIDDQKQNFCLVENLKEIRNEFFFFIKLNKMYLQVYEVIKYPFGNSFKVFADIKNNFRVKVMEQNLLNNKYRFQNLGNSQYTNSGSYSFIHLAQNIETKQIVAVKELKSSGGSRGLDPTVLRQKSNLVSLNHLKHENIVELKDFITTPNKVYLIFPYFKKNLKQFITQQYNSRVPAQIVQKIMRELLSALKTANSHRFMHRDIKMDNVLVEFKDQNPEQFTIKLADWGSSRKFNIISDQNFSQYVIAQIYKPPELLFHRRKYTENVDIWSMGCLFYQLLSGGERIFNYDTQNQLLYQILQKIGLTDAHDQKWVVQMYESLKLKCVEDDFIEIRSNSLDKIFIEKFGSVGNECDLMKKMLKINPERRISAFDALKHPYFDFNS